MSAIYLVGEMHFSEVGVVVRLGLFSQLDALINHFIKSPTVVGLYPTK